LVQVQRLAVAAVKVELELLGVQVAAVVQPILHNLVERELRGKEIMVDHPLVFIKEQVVAVERVQ
jgi:ABC-type uncharacterized transport system substrate-binding protein